MWLPVCSGYENELFLHLVSQFPPHHSLQETSCITSPAPSPWASGLQSHLSRLLVMWLWLPGHRCLDQERIPGQSWTNFPQESETWSWRHLSFHIGCLTREVIQNKKPCLIHMWCQTRKRLVWREREKETDEATGARDQVTLRRDRAMSCSRSRFQGNSARLQTKCSWLWDTPPWSPNYNMFLLQLSQVTSVIC